MAPAHVRALDVRRLLLEPGRNFDVAGARHPLQLLADPDRIADVLERVRADREVELIVLERPRLARADVALDPRVGAEALAARVALLVAVEAARVVGQQVDDPVRASE